MIRKRELSDQYFHRVEILLVGEVVSFVVKIQEGEDEELFFFLSPDTSFVFPDFKNSTNFDAGSIR